MTALHSAVRKQLKKPNYLALIVEPTDSFLPRNWQDIPSAYRIVEYVGDKKHRGDADAWKFIHNKEVMSESRLSSCSVPSSFPCSVPKRWAIWIS